MSATSSSKSALISAVTFAMTHAASGASFSVKEIKTRTELVLADRFARMVDVDACLSGLVNHQ